MTIGETPWRVRLAALAANDFHNIVRWTSERFGTIQARLYAETLMAALQTLESGPDVPGSRRRDEIASGLMTLHVARGRRRGRHLVLYRVGGSAVSPEIEVLRLLHDSMDLSRHAVLEESGDN
ncbi:MAG: type II toxin-antitoxin system RelE/ParE family toxin [Alphaproteobacteria bacterium]|nr:type II toxin-antitoxin system RelE/ParE family toxin [Alphaproteobacteria bacterium]